MELVLQKESASGALSQGTLLHGRYHIIKVIGMDERSMTYEAEDENGRTAIREYMPMAFVSREGEALVCKPEEEAAFREGIKQFDKTARILQKELPHTATVTEVFRENNTIYSVTPLPEGHTLRELSQITPTYVQSLGIELCESYAALHKAGLYYGTIHDEQLRFTQAGLMQLDPSPISTQGSAQEDMHSLTAFLAALLPEEEEDEVFQLLHGVLHRSYRDAASLKAALIGGKPASAGRMSGILYILVCLFFLAAGMFLMRQIPEKSVPLSGGLESGKIVPEVINVWLPLEETSDEATICAMYKRLAAGFERQNPGCGVNIRIYADDSFKDALANLEEGEQPAVFMDTQDDVILSKAAELDTLTAALEDVYLTDLTRFQTAVPLACSIPALYYNTRFLELTEGSVSFSELPANTLYDESAAEFLSRQNAEAKTAGYFAEFLADGRNPVLASSSCMAEAEHNGISSGAVHMAPIKSADGFPLQYEMYCTINRDSSANSQRVGMLWLQYLLTEEAQQVLFVEHYGDLPLHRSAFEHAAATHTELAVLGSSTPQEPESGETHETEVNQ